MTTRNLALIYSRKFVVRDPDRDISTERQGDACVRIAQTHGWRYEICRDQDVSDHADGRPARQCLLARMADSYVVAIAIQSLCCAARFVCHSFDPATHLTELPAFESFPEKTDRPSILGHLQDLANILSDISLELQKQTLYGLFECVEKIPTANAPSESYPAPGAARHSDPGGQV